MQEGSKISVIMPLFNAAKTLKRAIDSVIGQTYKNIELIVIDGGSTDGTQDIVKGYGDKIAYFISEKDQGYGDALNKGIAVATGEYSIILAGDDFFIPKGIENFINDIEGVPDVWCGNMFVLKGPGILTRFKRASSLEELNDIYKVMAHPATFFRVKAFGVYGGYDIRYKINCDTELIARMYNSGAKFQVSQKYICVFCCGGMSTNVDIDAEIAALDTIAPEEEVAIKNGLSPERAHKKRVAEVYKKKLLFYVKAALIRVHLLKWAYFIAGQRPLTKKEIDGYGIPIQYINREDRDPIHFSG